MSDALAKDFAKWAADNSDLRIKLDAAKDQLAAANSRADELAAKLKAVEKPAEVITLLCEKNGEPCDGFHFRNMVLELRKALATPAPLALEAFGKEQFINGASLMREECGNIESGNPWLTAEELYEQYRRLRGGNEGGRSE